MADLGILLTDALALKAYQGTKTVTRRPCNANGGPAVIRGAGTAFVGGRVWVRECWVPLDADGWGLPRGVAARRKRPKHVVYRASAGDSWVSGGCAWRPSIHMPKWASRTWGRIVSVRPCDLTDIDHAEAVREGFDSVPECLAGIRAIYPDTPVFWRIEWERIEVPNA